MLNSILLSHVVVPNQVVAEVALLLTFTAP